MNRILFPAIALGAVVAAHAPMPASAQEATPPSFWEEMPWVERGSFTLTGTDLTIQVDAEAPGTLVVLRGQSSRVQVRARADGGLAGFALPDRGRARLQLSGVGTDGLTYLVVVPPRARVIVRLPDRELPEGLRTLQDSRTFRWEAAEAGAPPPAPGGDG